MLEVVVTSFYLCFAVASLREELTPLAGEDKGFPQTTDSALHTDESSSRPPRYTG